VSNVDASDAVRHSLLKVQALKEKAVEAVAAANRIHLSIAKLDRTIEERFLLSLQRFRFGDTEGALKQFQAATIYKENAAELRSDLDRALIAAAESVEVFRTEEKRNERRRLFPPKRAGEPRPDSEMSTHLSEDRLDLLVLAAGSLDEWLERFDSWIATVSDVAPTEAELARIEIDLLHRPHNHTDADAVTAIADLEGQTIQRNPDGG